MLRDKQCAHHLVVVVLLLLHVCMLFARVCGYKSSKAVRLSQRDPDKKWLLGERLLYVLLTGW
jgi:hypothetical protein